MVPSISPFSVLLKCGVVLGSPLDVGPLLLSYCLRAAEIGGGSIYKATIFSGCLFIFPCCLRLTWHFLFSVLYICCLFTAWQGLLVPRVLTLNASGIPPKRYIKDGGAECLILHFNTITLLVMEADWYFTVWGCLHWWQQFQDVEDIRFLVFNFLHLCRRFIIGR